MSAHQSKKPAIKADWQDAGGTLRVGPQSFAFAQIKAVFMEIFWIVFLIISLQPLFMRRLQEVQRQTKMRDFAKARGSQVIALIHRQETMRLFGFPLARYIDMQDSETILRAIQKTPDKTPIDLILHTPGGLVLASTQIARAVRAHKGKVTVFIPHMAMSGGTLVALAADEVIMCEHSVLGPVDPQIGQMPAVSILKTVRQKPIEDVDDQTLVLADISKKAISQLREAVSSLLSDDIPSVDRLRITDALTSGKWTHDHPIFPDEAREMGFNVSTDMPLDVIDLMELYPQPTRTSTSVEFSPLPSERQGSKL